MVLESMDALRRWLRTGGKPRLRTVRAAHTYDLTPPNLFNLHARDTGKLANFCTMIARRQVQCPAEGVMLIDRCTVYDGKFIIMPTLEWLADSIVDFRAADQAIVSLRASMTQGQASALPPCRHPTFMIAKAGAENHGHVIAEMLPKLINIGRMGVRHIRLLLPACMDFYHRLIIDILRHLGVSADIAWAAPGTLMHAGPIHVMTEVSRHDARKSAALAELRPVIASLYGLNLRRERRLFVQRSSPEGRRLTNAAAVEAAFAAEGYSIVTPRALPLLDQIALFATASHVAGPLGAGLANIAFAPEDCEVLMIDPGLGDFFFWDMASLMKQRFTWYFAGEFRHYSPELATADYACDPVNLQTCLKILAG